MYRRTSFCVLLLASVEIACGPSSIEQPKNPTPTIEIAPARKVASLQMSGVNALTDVPTDVTQCPPGMYNDLSQRCVPHVIDSVAEAKESFGAMVPISPATGKTPAFAIDVTEVTVRAYESCVATGLCSPTAAESRDYYHTRVMGPCSAYVAGHGNHPVNCVNLAQAKAFCAWAGKRLPTAEEWVLAAKGPEHRSYPWGEKPPQWGELCWGQSCEVGSHPGDTTPDGVKDMGGSLTEWVDAPPFNSKLSITHGANWFNGSQLNPLTDGAPRMQPRGDSQYSAVTDDPSDLTGFRCARTL